MTYDYELYIEELDMEVLLEAEITLENDGIGSYEYWGSREHDAGSDYYAVTGLTYEKSNYTPEQIAIIDKYLEDNQEDIDEAIIKKYESSNDPF